MVRTSLQPTDGRKIDPTSRTVIKSSMGYCWRIEPVFNVPWPTCCEGIGGFEDPVPPEYRHTA